jgi:hypothetical protein
MGKRALPEPAATRYANQVLALHQALGLLRVYDLDPTRRPSAVKEALRILDDATEPLRPLPTTRQTYKMPEPEPEPEPAPEPPLPPPVRYKKSVKVVKGSPEHEARIKNRMDTGMTREMAEAHLASGARIGPSGEDLDVFNPQVQDWLDEMESVDIRR